MYNDIPNILSAYAITVTLTAASYRQTNSQQIVFERLYNGNYWIIPLAATSAHAWLVPNPTRKLDLTRLDSFPFAFDWKDRDTSTYQTTFTLLEPAMVSVLPIEPLAWKLIKRGSIRPFLNPDARLQNRAIDGKAAPEIEQMIEQAVNERISDLETQILDRLKAQIRVEIQEIHSIPIDKNQYDYDFSNNIDSTPVPEPESLDDLWRQSLTDMMIFGDDNAPEVETFDKSTAQNIEIENSPQSFEAPHYKSQLLMENL